MDQFIIERIKASPIFPDVVPYSIPVVSFGDFQKCEIATLGINPSKNEFVCKNGLKRFEDLLSIGIQHHGLITDEHAEQIYLSCKMYFKNNPYRFWFDKLQDHILNKLDVSYYNDSACHLDLVQWSTDPIWRHIDSKVQNELLKIDIPFLLKQLENSCINTLIMVMIYELGETIYFQEIA